MKIFLSWSGQTSQRVAEILRDWLPLVIQHLEPYVSSEDIAKGARWSIDIASELEEAQYGIICATKENIHAPWLNFEAGALSKAIESARVCPFLFGIDRAEVQGPLLQFQSTIYDKSDFRKLLRGINQASTTELPLDDSILERSFEVWWPDLDTRLYNLATEDTSQSPLMSSTVSEQPVTDITILEEILELVRTQQKLLHAPEKLIQPLHFEKFFEQYTKIENSVAITKVLKDIVEFAAQADFYAVDLKEGSSKEDIEQLKAKISSVAAAARYLQKILPQKTFSKVLHVFR